MGTKTLTGNWTRQTPHRQPGEPTATVVFQPFGRLSLPKQTNLTRRRQKDKAKQQALMVHAMVAEIGRNPVYDRNPRNPLNVDRNGPADKAYRRAAVKWLGENQSRFTG